MTLLIWQSRQEDLDGLPEDPPSEAASLELCLGDWVAVPREGPVLHDTVEVLRFCPSFVRKFIPEFTVVTDFSRPLMDEERYAEATGIGEICGGDLFDVMAITYGNDTTIRLRYELTQERDWFRPPADWTLERALEHLVDALQAGWGLNERPRPIIYRNQQVQQFLRDQRRRLEFAASAPELAPNGEIRIWSDHPEQHDMN